MKRKTVAANDAAIEQQSISDVKIHSSNWLIRRKIIENGFNKI